MGKQQNPSDGCTDKTEKKEIITPNHVSDRIVSNGILFLDSFKTRAVNLHPKSLYLVSRLWCEGENSKVSLLLDYQNKICSEISNSQWTSMRFIAKKNEHQTMTSKEEDGEEYSCGLDSHSECNQSCKCSCKCAIRHNRKVQSGKWDYQFLGDVFRVTRSNNNITQICISIGGLFCVVSGYSQHLQHFLDVKQVYIQIFICR